MVDEIRAAGVMPARGDGDFEFRPDAVGRGDENRLPVRRKVRAKETAEAPNVAQDGRRERGTDRISRAAECGRLRVDVHASGRVPRVLQELPIIRAERSEVSPAQHKVANFPRVWKSTLELGEKLGPDAMGEGRCCVDHDRSDSLGLKQPEERIVMFVERPLIVQEDIQGTLAGRQKIHLRAIGSCVESRARVHRLNRFDEFPV
jgi:hypothetical protein